MSSLDSISEWCRNADRLYILGGMLSVCATSFLVYERTKSDSHTSIRRFWGADIVLVVAGMLTCLGSLGAIHYGHRLDGIKQQEATSYRERSRLELDRLERINEEAQKQLLTQQEASTASRAELWSLRHQSKELAATLAMQQSLVAAQVHQLPELEERQIAAFAERFKPYRGNAVIFYKGKQEHDKQEDFTSSLTAALELAHVEVYEQEDGSQYFRPGVCVLVHSQEHHPLLADVLVRTFSAIGLPVNTLAWEKVPAGKVGLHVDVQ